MEMEFAKFSLANIIDHRNNLKLPFTYLEILKIFNDIFANLLQLYRNNVCHLDLKPDNILYLSMTDEFVFADFGLSQ